LTQLAPIALFVYNRPNHTRQTVEALLLNCQAKDSDLYVFSDAPKNEAARAEVEDVRDYIKQISGFKKVTIVKRDKNLGLANSVIDGVTRLCEDYGKVIVLEDDIQTSQHFLSFMNDALTLYENDDLVCSVSGYMFPINFKTSHQTLMVDLTLSWGWATWSRAWKEFNSNGQNLKATLQEKNLIKRFDKTGPNSFIKMLSDQINKKNDSWLVRWHASNFILKKVTLAPVISLVRNTGIDGSGVHCASWKFNPYTTEISDSKVIVKRLDIHVDQANLKKLKFYFIKVKFLRYVNAIFRLLSRQSVYSKIKSGV